MHFNYVGKRYLSRIFLVSITVSSFALTYYWLDNSASEQLSEKGISPVPSDLRIGDQHENYLFEKIDKNSWHFQKKELENQLAKSRFAAVQSISNTNVNIPGLTGRWYERGSRNLAGRITNVTYDHRRNKIYAFSHGGYLWRANKNGSNWTCLNPIQSFDFTQNCSMLEYVKGNNAGSDYLILYHGILDFFSFSFS